jgi:DnaJ-class molecular chaperone
MNESFYNILEIPETANPNEIKQAFRKLSMKYHPDKNNNIDATSKFQKISEAYSVLSDVDKKREYDMSLRLNLNLNPGFKNDIDEIFSGLFGMPFPFNQMGGMGPMNSGMGMGMGPNVRIFHNGVPLNRAMQKPVPIIQNVTISIDKILTNTTIPIDIERWLIHNENKVFEKETLYVDIPKGIDDGEIIILRNKGNIINDDLKGDVKLFVKIDNNSEFKRHGLDLIYEKTITLKEALCGFSFPIKSINNTMYTINNTSGVIIYNGYQKIIPQMGLSRDEHVGNLIIVFQVKFPDKLSPETINELMKLHF